jgi:hypothetical protein
MLLYFAKSQNSRILEDYATRFSNVIISGDFNINILADNVHWRDFLDVLSGIGLTVVNSVQPTQFGQRPTLIDLFITNNSESVKLYSQVDLAGFLSRHDLILCVYDFIVDSSQTRTVTYRQLDLNAALHRCMTFPWWWFNSINKICRGTFSKTRKCKKHFLAKGF